ncbi:hypothetical protein N9F54_00470 [Actinomycetota bacterium]|nr:hypothetical protein [Actinomycetota bacterium]
MKNCSAVFFVNPIVNIVMSGCPHRGGRALCMPLVQPGSGAGTEGRVTSEVTTPTLPEHGQAVKVRGVLYELVGDNP